MTIREGLNNKENEINDKQQIIGDLKRSIISQREKIEGIEIENKIKQTSGSNGERELCGREGGEGNRRDQN